MLASLLPVPMEFTAVNNNEVFIRPALGYKFASYYKAVNYVTLGAGERHALVDLFRATHKNYTSTQNNTSCIFYNNTCCEILLYADELCLLQMISCKSHFWDMPGYKPETVQNKQAYILYICSYTVRPLSILITQCLNGPAQPALAPFC